nr:hypothetical protein DM860_015757 [Ipomoea batatas]
MILLWRRFLNTESSSGKIDRAWRRRRPSITIAPVVFDLAISTQNVGLVSRKAEGAKHGGPTLAPNNPNRAATAGPKISLPVHEEQNHLSRAGLQLKQRPKVMKNYIVLPILALAILTNIAFGIDHDCPISFDVDDVCANIDCQELAKRHWIGFSNPHDCYCSARGNKSTCHCTIICLKKNIFNGY